MRTILLALTFTVFAGAQEHPTIPRWNKPFQASVVALGASKVFDITSTRHAIGRGAHETNPFFGPALSNQDYAISAAWTLGLALVEVKIVKDHPGSKAAKVFTILNSCIAGGTTTLAVRNLKQKR